MSVITGIALAKGAITLASSYGAKTLIKSASKALVILDDCTKFQKGCIALGTWGLAGAAGKVAGDFIGEKIDKAVSFGEKAKKYFSSSSEDDKEEKQDETEHEVVEAEVIDPQEAVN